MSTGPRHVDPPAPPSPPLPPHPAPPITPRLQPLLPKSAHEPADKHLAPALRLCEVQPRCSRGAAEVQPRCSRGAAEVQQR